ncbi:MAG: MFS transporter [Clostridia bacterium]|nr:MFS transporter [Clostridia bacterium]
MPENTLAKKRTSPFRYGIGMFGTSIPINMFKSFAAAFYVKDLGLIDTNQMAKIIFIYTFIDAIDNPVYGFLSDRTKTKWGKRRPWLVIGTPLLILSFILFYNMPEGIRSNSAAAYIYILLMYILTGTLDSLINANYGALFPTLFKTDGERASTNAIRQVCQLVAMVISIVLTPMVTSAIGYGLTAVIYGIIALAVILYMTFGCYEKIEEEEYELAKGEKPDLLKAIVALAKNPKFWIFGFAGAFYSASFSLISQAIPFYVQYTLGLKSSMTTVMLGVVFGVALIGIVIWSRIIQKVNIIKIWRIGFLIMAAGFVPLFFASGFKSAVPITSIMGMGVAACLVTMDCIAAKIIDDDYAKHGVKREGMLTSLVGVMNRLNGLYVSLGFKVMYDVFGFVDGNNPGANPSLASKVLLCIFPFVAMTLAFLFSLFLHFDNKTNTAVENG